MNLQQLYYFKTIAEMEHYTRASEKLLISQPSLSYAMSELERELGAPLFQKHGRGVTLTRYGRTFLEYATKSLQELETGQRKVAELLNPEAGLISISYASSMSFGYIPYIISVFYEKEGKRDIKFAFETRPTEESLALLAENRIDLAFGSKPMDPEIACAPIYTEKMVVVVPNHHPLAGRKSVDLRELADAELVTWNSKCASRREIEELYNKIGVVPNIAYEVMDEIMIIGIVSRGMGIGVIPQMLGTEYKKVTSLEIENFEARRTMYMMWRKDVYLPPVVERFRQFVLRQPVDL